MREKLTLGAHNGSGGEVAVVALGAPLSVAARDLQFFFYNVENV